MSKLLDITTFILKNSTKAFSMPVADLSRIIYLCDWKSAIENGNQLTDLAWTVQLFGPKVDDMEAELSAAQDFVLETTTTDSGKLQKSIRLKNPSRLSNLSSSDMEVLTFVLKQTQNMDLGQLLQLIFSTYPMATGNLGHELDLKSLASQYNQIKEKLFVKAE